MSNLADRAREKSRKVKKEIDDAIEKRISDYVSIELKLMLETFEAAIERRCEYGEKYLDAYISCDPWPGSAVGSGANEAGKRLLIALEKFAKKNGFNTKRDTFENPDYEYYEGSPKTKDYTGLQNEKEWFFDGYTEHAYSDWNSSPNAFYRLKISWGDDERIVE